MEINGRRSVLKLFNALKENGCTAETLDLYINELDASLKFYAREYKRTLMYMFLME